MYFTDKSLYPNPPIAELAAIDATERNKWLAYKRYLANKKNLPKVAKPSGQWTKDEIRDPLVSIFKSNCGYCGVFADKNNDGQVDHFLPVEKDTNAAHIYSWDNYIWSCVPCNKQKGTNYPLINPCVFENVKDVYFHHGDGRYEIRNTADDVVKNKFDLTERKTSINGRNNPQKRKISCRQLNNVYLRDIYESYKVYEIFELIDPKMPETTQAYTKLVESINEFKEFLKTREYVMLVKQVFYEYKEKTPGFAFELEDFYTTL